ncbi:MULTISPECIES: hypothetical protein [Streptomyces]|uniref:hypothetical protein n=1 Tax=Streptomyces TaxID=1883 RepID=UPI0004CD19C7|nr:MULTISPECIES: hypothetical protein [Streptomyces]
MTGHLGMDAAPRPVTITTDGPTAHVTVDGHDLSRQVRAYTVQHEAGQHPQLLLYAKPGADIALDGLAYVAVAAEDPAPAVIDFLRGIDPAALEQAALERDDLDDTRNALTRAMLTQLIEWATGGPQ